VPAPQCDIVPQAPGHEQQEPPKAYKPPGCSGHDDCPALVRLSLPSRAPAGRLGSVRWRVPAGTRWAAPEMLPAAQRTKCLCLSTDPMSETLWTWHPRAVWGTCRPPRPHAGTIPDRWVIFPVHTTVSACTVGNSPVSSSDIIPLPRTTPQVHLYNSSHPITLDPPLQIRLFRVPCPPGRGRKCQVMRQKHISGPLAAADACGHPGLRRTLELERQVVELHDVFHRHLVALCRRAVLQNRVQDCLRMRED